MLILDLNLAQVNASQPAGPVRYFKKCGVGTFLGEGCLLLNQSCSNNKLFFSNFRILVKDGGSLGKQ